MTEPVTAVLTDYPLDVFGQQPVLYNLYTQICLCFPLPDPSSHSGIVERLSNGLERLSASFPWVAGQVVNEGGPAGIYKIVPLQRTPELVIKDLRSGVSRPSLDEMISAGFPMTMLDENIICPRKTLAAKTAADGDPAPAFLVQANFITGGLLLVFVGQHNVMDMTGQGQMVRLLSKACRSDPFTHDELTWGNRDRSSVIPLLDDQFDPSIELARIFPKEPPLPPAAPESSTAAAVVAVQFSPPTSPPKCSWAYFVFSPASLAALEALATKTGTLQPGYVSTDDAISAFVWQSVMRARLLRLDPSQEVTFARAIDPRRFLGIPETYPGVVQNMTYHTYTLQELLDEPLGNVASNLRAALDLKSSRAPYNTRALATFLDKFRERRSSVSVSASLDPGSDIQFSSWAREKFYELDFNMGLGRPVAARRPVFDPVESLLYLMPKTLDGEIALAVCLRDEDMARLAADEHFTRYASYVG